MSGPGIAGQAQAYAAHGWPVFPCQPGSKEPATRHGFLDATTDPDRIGWWWRRQPGANVAIATGQPGPDVLDVDQHGQAGSGFAALNRLKRAGLTEGAAAIVATPSGGMHLYFVGSDQRCGKLPSCHLDFRAQGGYILAPPSQVGGRSYRVVRHQVQAGGLDWGKVTELLEPQRHAAILPAVVSDGDLSHLAAWVGRQHEGNRNDGLFWAACRAAEAGDETVLAELAAAARSAGLPDREVGATIASARRAAGHRQPEHYGGRECAP
jgi:Bifunctional DNA primase/polymerase, N-terminal